MRKGLLAILVLTLAGCGGSEAERTTEATEQMMADAMSAAEEEAAEPGRTPVEIRTSECLLWPADFRGPCAFEPRGRGSFAVTLEDGATFYDDVRQILVSVFLEGQADVRVIKADGTSELLGEAHRSEKFPACWIGTGFSVCAY